VRFRRRSNGGASATTIFFATDVHGSERCFRKFLNAARVYEANVLVLGGDITGKTLIPVERGPGGWSTQVRDHSHRDLDDAGIAEVEQHIFDLGMYPIRGSREELLALDDPDERERLFVEAVRGQMGRWAELADERLARTGVRCLIAPGNDDPFEIDDVLARSETIEMAEGRCISLDDGREVITTGWSNETPWKTPREATEDDLAARLEAMAAEVSDPERLVLVAHPPPRDTDLDQAPAITGDFRIKMELGAPQMASVGSSAVRTFIEERRPLLGLHGHVHESKGIQLVGRTVCINPGSEYSDGVLCGAIVRLDGDRVVSRQLIIG
jgi:uncharacterized protein